MRYDGHVHTALWEGYNSAPEDNGRLLMERLAGSGLSGAAVISVNPMAYGSWSPEKRIEDVMKTCGVSDTLFPYYFVNPLESDAVSQVRLAAENGIAGFKMMCSEYRVDCTQSMDVVSEIAKAGKPVLFHSGICWDGMNSANNHKPANFEALIDIPGLKFCLAHVSWPWYDECIAVYGKFANAYAANHDSPEMFIDITPGTPRPYREEVLTRLIKWSEYELRYNLIFGTDCCAFDYNSPWSDEWQKRDDAIYEKLVEDPEDFKAHVYGMNLLRFIGKSEEKVERKSPLVAK